MTVLWERFAGSTDSFAVRLAFMSDPDHGAAADPAESASWGAFQLWVDGQNLCAHVDQGEVIQSAHWYLLPLLEWFADNWNPILHEEKPPNRNVADTAVKALEETRYVPVLAGEAEALAWDEERYEWRSRHALRAARDGGLLPNVVIRRLRDLVEISWRDEPLPGTPAGFRYSATVGTACLYPEQVAHPLYEILTAAADYLYDSLPAGERVAELREKVALLDEPTATSVRLEWLAGLREAPPLTGRLGGAVPEREMRVRWSRIVDALGGLGDSEGAQAALAVEESSLVITGSCHAALMFSSMSPTVSEKDVRTLATVMVEQYSRASITSGLAGLSRPVTLDSVMLPWEQGYDLAEAIHSELNLDLSSGWVDIVGVLDSLGVSILSRGLDDHDIRACCIAGERHVPAIVRNETSPFYVYPNAQRFSLAHEFCHLLFDQSRGKRLAIASGPWAPRGLERRANAFAAMFLMPSELVEAAIADIPDPIHDIASIGELANRLRVSRRAVTEHLYNLTLMAEVERDELLRRLPD